jgi:hypothetical protein
METRNAIICDASIEIADPGILVASICLDYGGSNQVFGRGVYMSKYGVDGKNYAGHFIYRVLDVAGADRWEHLKGKAVRVKGDSSHIEAIGHIIKDAWFDPGKEFKQPDREVSA